jgi:hypothetical protein
MRTGGTVMDAHHELFQFLVEHEHCDPPGEICEADSERSA